jgi:uncharacterized membrane protein YccC
MTMPAQNAGWLRRHMGDVRLAARAVVAAVLAFTIATLVGLPQAYWSVIAALLVIQATVGASFQSSIDWLVGTIGGAVFGSLVGAAVPHDDRLMTGLTLVVALAPLALLAAVNNRYRIAPITAVIALIVPRPPEVGAIAFTLDRTAEIGIGAVVAVAVSLLVLPSRAHGLLAEAVGRVLRAVADLLPTLLTEQGRPGEERPLAVIADLTRKIDALNDAAVEARRERQLHVTDDPDPDLLVLSVTRVRNDASMIFRATIEPFPAAIFARLAGPAAELAAAAAVLLRDIAVAFEARRHPPALAGFEAAHAAYRAAVESIRKEGMARALPDHEVERLFTLGFAYDLLRGDLRDLCDCCAGYARRGHGGDPAVRGPAA